MPPKREPPCRLLPKLMGLPGTLWQSAINNTLRQPKGDKISRLYGSLDGRGVSGRMNTCIKMAKSLCCSLETVTTLLISCTPIQGFPGGSDGKESAWNAGDLGSIHGLRRSAGEGNGYPLQYSCLENPMDRGAWWATVHGVTKSRTWLSSREQKLMEILPNSGRSWGCALRFTPHSHWTNTMKKRFLSNNVQREFLSQPMQSDSG